MQTRTAGPKVTRGPLPWLSFQGVDTSVPLAQAVLTAGAASAAAMSVTDTVAVDGPMPLFVN
eukprot:6462157-Amphidinium_carterae.2